jgi:hypothetical protein
MELNERAENCTYQCYSMSWCPNTNRPSHHTRNYKTCHQTRSVSRRIKFMYLFLFNLHVHLCVQFNHLISYRTGHSVSFVYSFMHSINGVFNSSVHKWRQFLKFFIPNCFESCSVRAMAYKSAQYQCPYIGFTLRSILVSNLLYIPEIHGSNLGRHVLHVNAGIVT